MYAKCTLSFKTAAGWYKQVLSRAMRSRSKVWYRAYYFRQSLWFVCNDFLPARTNPNVHKPWKPIFAPGREPWPVELWWGNGWWASGVARSSFRSPCWIQVLSWGDINKQRAFSPSLGINVTPTRLFLTRWQFAFLWMKGFQQRWIRIQRLWKWLIDVFMILSSSILSVFVIFFWLSMYSETKNGLKNQLF